MRRRFYLRIIDSSRTLRARDLAHALELAAEVEGTWRVTMRVGSGDEVTVRTGVGVAA